MALTKEDLQAIQNIVGDSEKRIYTEFHKAIDKAIDELSETMSDGFTQVGREFEIVNGRLDILEADVAELKADVAILKTDVAILKTDVAELKTDMREVKWRLNDTVTRTEFHGLHQRVDLIAQHQPA